MAEAKFYTYIHRRADTGEVFYVGKGVRRRATNIKQRNAYWHKVVDKHGLSVEYVAYFYMEIDALDHEIQLISEYRAAGVPLANLTDGGQGTSGRSHSLEAIEKMRIAATGRIPSAEARARMSAAGKSKTMSQEHRRRLSESGRIRFSTLESRVLASDRQKGRVISAESIEKSKETKRLRNSGSGWRHSEETKKKMSDTRIGKPIKRSGKPHPKKGPMLEETKKKISDAMKKTLAAKSLFRVSNAQS